MEPANLKESLVLFVDFLGFSEVSKNPSDPRVVNLLKLLNYMVSMRSDASAETSSEGQSTLYKLEPAISTFSDHIVVSYPMPTERWGDLSIEAQFLTMLSGVRNIAGKLAMMALDNGMLIRGGLTVGQLYHKNSVVFGPGMVFAYELEAKTSFYPRIAVSPTVVHQTPKERTSYFATDADGVSYLDYFYLAPYLYFRPPVEEAFRLWSEDMIAIIDTEIAKLKSLGRLTDLARWTWFRGKFAKGLERGLAKRPV